MLHTMAFVANEAGAVGDILPIVLSLAAMLLVVTLFD